MGEIKPVISVNKLFLVKNKEKWANYVYFLLNYLLNFFLAPSKSGKIPKPEFPLKDIQSNAISQNLMILIAKKHKCTNFFPVGGSKYFTWNCECLLSDKCMLLSLSLFFLELDLQTSTNLSPSSIADWTCSRRYLKRIAKWRQSRGYVV